MATVTQIIAGPKLYQASSPAPKLQPKPVNVISPTGDPATDKTYYKNLDAEAKQFGAITAMINKLPMGRNGFTLTGEMEEEMISKNWESTNFFSSLDPYEKFLKVTFQCSETRLPVADRWVQIAFDCVSFLNCQLRKATAALANFPPFFPK